MQFSKLVSFPSAENTTETYSVFGFFNALTLVEILKCYLGLYIATHAVYIVACTYPMHVSEFRHSRSRFCLTNLGDFYNQVMRWLEGGEGSDGRDLP